MEELAIVYLKLIIAVMNLTPGRLPIQEHLSFNSKK